MFERIFSGIRNYLAGRKPIKREKRRDRYVAKLKRQAESERGTPDYAGELETLGREQVEMGRYEEAAKTFETAANEARKWEDTEKDEPRYREMAKRVRARHRRAQGQEGDLEESVSGKMAAFLTIASFILALLFLSSNFTGFTIANTSLTLSNWIGAGFFLLALTFSFNLFRRKK